MSESFLVMLRSGIEVALMAGIALSLVRAALRARQMTAARVAVRVRTQGFGRRG